MENTKIEALKKAWSQLEETQKATPSSITSLSNALATFQQTIEKNPDNRELLSRYQELEHSSERLIVEIDMMNHRASKFNRRIIEIITRSLE